MANVNIVLFDTETTGFPLTPVETQDVTLQPRIIQIHAIQLSYDNDDPINSARVVDVLSSYVSGCDSVPAKITEITGITDSDLNGAPPWSEVRTQFFAMCTDAGIVCSHNFQFDARMVYCEERRLGFQRPFSGVKHRCTLQKSRLINTSAKSHALGNLYKHLFAETLDGAHNAEVDTRGLMRVYLDLVVKKAWVDEV